MPKLYSFYKVSRFYSEETVINYANYFPDLLKHIYVVFRDLQGCSEIQLNGGRGAQRQFTYWMKDMVKKQGTVPSTGSELKKRWGL